jgi:hypothetical protein
LGIVIKNILYVIGNEMMLDMIKMGAGWVGLVGLVGLGWVGLGAGWVLVGCWLGAGWVLVGCWLGAGWVLVGAIEANQGNGWGTQK